MRALQVLCRNIFLHGSLKIRAAGDLPESCMHLNFAAQFFFLAALIKPETESFYVKQLITYHAPLNLFWHQGGSLRSQFPNCGSRVIGAGFASLEELGDVSPEHLHTWAKTEVPAEHGSAAVPLL